MTEYLRVSGVYWGLTAMSLMKKLDAMNQQEVLDFVLACQHSNGGFGACQNHDAHLLYTLSSIQVCVIPCIAFANIYLQKDDNPTS